MTLRTPTGGIARLGPTAGRGQQTGNAGIYRQTVVQTIDRANGMVLFQEVFKGAPFLMRHDIVVAKRVFKLAQKLHGRLPRRTVKRKHMEAAGLATFIEGRAAQRALCPPT